MYSVESNLSYLMVNWFNMEISIYCPKNNWRKFIFVCKYVCNTLVCDSIFKLDTCSTEKTFLTEFLEILKHLFQNFKKILKNNVF